MEHNLKDFKKKEQLLRRCLANLQDMYINEFKNHTEETYLALQDNQTDFNDSLITYNDYYRKTMSKLMTMTLDKNTLFDLCNYVISTNKQRLGDSKADIKNLKQKFDEICRYDSKSENACKYYDEALFCSYVASKTFKKTAVEVFEFLYYGFDLDEYLTKTYFHCILENSDHKPLHKEKNGHVVDIQTDNNLTKPKKVACSKTNDWLKSGIKIASIGGGPGNDCLAVYTYLLGCNSKKLHFNPKCSMEVYDLNYKGWQESHQEMLERYFKGHINIKWNFTNHLSDYTLGHLHADFITVCWTLNENLGFNRDYWDQLIRNNINAVFLVIEGEKKNVDLLVDIFEHYEFRHIYYEREANPRKLIAHY